MLRIEPVPVSARKEALRFMVAGAAEDFVADAQAQSLEERLCGRKADNLFLWWALRPRCVAVAAVFTVPGRTGHLVYCPLHAPGVERDAVAAVANAAATEAIKGGLSFVQVLFDPAAADDVEMIRQGGFESMAELVYMRLDVNGAQQAQAAPEVSWLTYGEFSEDRLAGVIEATYADSLDCPLLAGVREMKDVIACHKASGVFRPQSWWIVQWCGQDAGCILVNDERGALGASVVYVGVRPEFRGRALGALMIRRAAQEARKRARSCLTLAVDAGNHYAYRLYVAMGFQATHRRLAYAMFRPRGDSR